VLPAEIWSTLQARGGKYLPMRTCTKTTYQFLDFMACFGSADKATFQIAQSQDSFELDL